MLAAKYILPIDPPKEQIYPMKLKGISICFSMLKAALCGNYVNFGVFRLYGDDTLENALKTFIKLLLCIPRNGLLVKTKLYNFCLGYYKIYLLKIFHVRNKKNI